MPRGIRAIKSTNTKGTFGATSGTAFDTEENSGFENESNRLESESCGSHTSHKRMQETLL